MDSAIGFSEITRRTLRVLDALALPMLLAIPLAPFLGSKSGTVWVASGLLGVWLVRRIWRATDWHVPYRARFSKVIAVVLGTILLAELARRGFS